MKRAIQDLTWMDKAACIGMTNIFFQEKGVHDSPGKIEKAKTICRGCPVIEDCLEYALTMYPQPEAGVWGGKTRPQLNAMRLRIKRSEKFSI